MGRRPLAIAGLETWFSARAVGFSRSSSPFVSTENGIPAGKPNASSRRVSIQRRVVPRFRPRGVTAKSFTVASEAFFANANRPGGVPGAEDYWLV